MPDSTYWQRVASEVRAEMARQRKSGVDLAKILGKTPATARSRMKGDSPFDAREIAAIAAWLDVPLDSLVLPAGSAA